MASARQARSWNTPARKSPLRVVTGVPPADASAGPAPPPREMAGSPTAVRRMMMSEFEEWLRTRTSRHGRPFQDFTVSAYLHAAAILDAWMTATGLETDFTGCDTATLNRFFAGYLTAHSQGGTNTKQRNLRHLFTWLEQAYGHPHPYTDGLHRYAPVRVRP